MPVQYWDGDSWETRDGPYQANPTNAFLAALHAILGDSRLIFLPQPADTTTSTDKSRNARTFNHSSSIAARLGALGLGYYATFDGLADYASVVDAAGLTFGTGTADGPMSIVALVNALDSAAAKIILSKNDNAGQQEWEFSLGSTELLNVKLFDESAGVAAQRSSSAAINLSQWTLLGMSYAGTGGATAADGITLYENGAVKASTATNNASYVAMEDRTTPVGLGMYIPSAPALFFKGSIALVALTAKNLADWEHWAIRDLCQGFFGFLG